MRPVLDDEQILAQAVVQFGGDALALVFLRFDQLARKGLLRRLRPFQLRDAGSIGKHGQSGDAHRRQRQKPPRPIERRQHPDAQTVALRVPHAVAIGRDHLERVGARRHVRVIRRAPRAGFDPVVIQSFQPVFEADAAQS